MKAQLVVAYMALLGSAVAANAAMVVFSTPAGSISGGQPVNAQATFTTSTDTVTVILRNLLADPRSVSQNLSGLSFTVSTGQTSGTLVSSLGVPVTVASGGSYTDGAAAATGWQLVPAGGRLILNVLGAPNGPAYTIIGPPGASGYTDANKSIAGNGPHNPFIDQTATFTVTVRGVTANSIIDSATFSFGTTAGNDVIGTASTSAPTFNVPEPAALALMALGGLAMLRRRKRA